MRQLFGYSFPEMRVLSGGQRAARRRSSSSGRTAHYGGPFKITTGASLFEDSFEFLTNSKRSRLAYWCACPRCGWARCAKWTASRRGKRPRRSASRPAANRCSRRWMANRSGGCRWRSGSCRTRFRSSNRRHASSKFLQDIVEPFTHAFTSLALARAGAGRLPRFGTAMLVVSGMAPDLDYASYIGGAGAFMRFHRTALHSIAGSAVMACAVAGAFCVSTARYRQEKNPANRRAARVPCRFRGMRRRAAGHVLLDLASGVGVQLLWPFRAHWTAWDLINDLDLWALLLHRGTSAAHAVRPGERRGRSAKEGPAAAARRPRHVGATRGLSGGAQTSMAARLIWSFRANITAGSR